MHCKNRKAPDFGPGLIYERFKDVLNIRFLQNHIVRATFDDAG